MLHKLWDLITGGPKKPEIPRELQYHNPLKASVGTTVSFEHHELTGINFFVEGIHVYETKVGRSVFFHTDYLLRGIKIDTPKPIRLRLRLTADEDADVGHVYQLLFLYDEMGWDQDFYYDVLLNPSGEFHVNQDGRSELETPWIYFRINDVRESYHARLTAMKDADRNGTIEDDELDHSDVTYWDYHREVIDEEGKAMECLYVELDEETKYFTFLRGRVIQPFQVVVI